MDSQSIAKQRDESKTLLGNSPEPQEELGRDCTMLKSHWATKTNSGNSIDETKAKHTAANADPFKAFGFHM